MLAKSYFDSGEYSRVSTSVDFAADSERVLLCLALYSEYLSFKSRQASKETALSANSSVDWSLLSKHAEMVYSRFSTDPVVNYLYGIVMVASDESVDRAFGLDLLFASIRSCEYSWGAWVELSVVPEISDRVKTDISQLSLYPFYKVEKYMYMNQPQKALHVLSSLSTQFPVWGYILERTGSAHHDMRQFGEAVKIFSSLSQLHPYCADGMDLYSNCLFLAEQQSELYELAQRWLKTSPNISETNVILGN
jgi:hypothetical protein